MIDIETIGVEFRTDGLVKGQRALKDTEQAAHRTADAADKVGDRGSRGFKAYGDAAAMAERQTRVLADTSATASRLMGAAFAGLGVSQLISLTDQYTKFTAQLKLASTSTAEYANAYADVQRISKVAQSDLGATGTLFARIANGTRELGISQQRVADITETTSLALKVSGATAQESASAMLQLSQAFGSGVLRGEEFNAVNEAAPRLMKALADGIGAPVGALRKMAEQGKLTSAVLAEALPKALEDLRKEASQVQTIAGSFTLLKNSVMEFVGTQAQASGSVNALTSGVALLANNIETLSAVALGFGAAKFAEILIGVGTAAQRNVASTLEYIAAQQAQKASAIAAAQAEVMRAESMLATAATTKSAIALSREEAVSRLAVARVDVVAAQSSMAASAAAEALSIAKLNLARTDIAAAQASMAASAAAGAQSFALKIQREATNDLAVAGVRLATQEASLTLATYGQRNATNDLAAAEARRAALVAELALLGQQQARVSAQITAATAAQTAAQSALTAATGVGGAAAGMASRAMGLLGGPIGLITTALGLGATAWALWGNSASKDATQAKESVMESSAVILAELDKQIERNERLIAMQKQGVSFAKAQVNERNTAKLAKLGQDVAAINSGADRYSQMNETEKYFERLAVMKEIADINAKMQSANASDERAKSFKQEATDLIEVRMHLAGINKSYFEDLEKYQKALAAGAISEAEYIKGVSELATETYKSSKAGKDASKGATLAGQMDKAQTAQDLKEYQAEIALEKHIYGDRNSFLQKYFAAGLISEEEYYRGRGVAQQEYLDHAKGYYAEEIKDIQDYMAKAKPKERIDGETKLNDVLAKQRELMREMAGASASDEIDRISKRTVAVIAYTKALEDQLRTQRDANTLAVAGVGRGDRENNLNSRVFDVRREFDKQQRDLATQLTGPNAISQKEYDEKLALLKRYEKDAVKTVLDGDAQIRQAQSDWTNGATRALENYRDAAANVALQTENVFTSAFKSMEDAIVQFAMTGKLSFGDLAKSIIANLIRIQAQEAITKSFGGLSKLFGLAGGGGYQGAAGADGAGSVADFMAMDAAPSLDGGGFTGNGPRSGGIDGKGGFPAIMHPQETVIDHSRGQSVGGGKAAPVISPTYNIRIDGSTDMARNQEMIHAAVQRGNAELVDTLERNGLI